MRASPPSATAPDPTAADVTSGEEAITGTGSIPNADATSGNSSPTTEFEGMIGGSLAGSRPDIRTSFSS